MKITLFSVWCDCFDQTWQKRLKQEITNSWANSTDIELFACAKMVVYWKEKTLQIVLTKINLPSYDFSDFDG